MLQTVTFGAKLLAMLQTVIFGTKLLVMLQIQLWRQSGDAANCDLWSQVVGDAANNDLWGKILVMLQTMTFEV